MKRTKVKVINAGFGYYKFYKGKFLFSKDKITWKTSAVNEDKFVLAMIDLHNNPLEDADSE